MPIILYMFLYLIIIINRTIALYKSSCDYGPHASAVVNFRFSHDILNVIVLYVSFCGCFKLKLNTIAMLRAPAVGKIVKYRLCAINRLMLRSSNFSFIKQSYYYKNLISIVASTHIVITQYYFNTTRAASIDLCSTVSFKWVIKLLN